MEIKRSLYFRTVSRCIRYFLLLRIFDDVPFFSVVLSKNIVRFFRVHMYYVWVQPSRDPRGASKKTPQEEALHWTYLCRQDPPQELSAAKECMTTCNTKLHTEAV